MAIARPWARAWVGAAGVQVQGVTAELAGEVAALRALLYERSLSDYLGRQS